MIEELASGGVHEKVFEIVQRLPGISVFDAPTGYGALTERLLASGRTVTACDIDIEKFKLSADRENLTLLQFDLTNPDLPVAEGTFDIVVCVEGIEHLENQWVLIRNLARLLKPSGHLILTTPNIVNFRSRLRYFLEGRYEFFKRPLVQGKSPAHDLNTYHIAPVSYFELQFIMESCGFAIKELHTNKYSSRNLLSMLLRPVFRIVYAYKDRRDKKRGRGDYAELYRTIMSEEVYFGESLIIVAKKL